MNVVDERVVCCGCNESGEVHGELRSGRDGGRVGGGVKSDMKAIGGRAIGGSARRDGDSWMGRN